MDALSEALEQLIKGLQREHTQADYALAGP